MLTECLRKPSQLPVNPSLRTLLRLQTYINANLNDATGSRNGPDSFESGNQQIGRVQACYWPIQAVCTDHPQCCGWATVLRGATLAAVTGTGLLKEPLFRFGQRIDATLVDLLQESVELGL